MAGLHAERFPWSGLRCGIPFATGSQGFPETPLDVTMQGLFYQTSTAVFRSSCFFNSLLRCRAPTIIQKTFGEVYRKHLAQGSRLKFSVLRSRPVVRCVQCRRVLEGSRRIRGRKVAGKEMAEQDMEYTLHIHHCWTKKMKNLFQHAHLGMQNPSVVMESPWRRWQE